MNFILNNYKLFISIWHIKKVVGPRIFLNYSYNISMEFTIDSTNYFQNISKCWTFIFLFINYCIIFIQRIIKDIGDMYNANKIIIYFNTKGFIHV